MNRKILIIGGMGPQASLYLHKLILDEAVKYGAKQADDFPEILHCSIPFPDFITEPGKRHEALAVLKESLYCLWQAFTDPRRYCLQYGPFANRRHY